MEKWHDRCTILITHFFSISAEDSGSTWVSLHLPSPSVGVVEGPAPEASEGGVQGHSVRSSPSRFLQHSDVIFCTYVYYCNRNKSCK